MKRKAPIGIGHRMVAELYQLFPNKSDRSIARMMGCSPRLLTEWKAGGTPSSLFLVSLHEVGGDVIWVLTGGRNENK